MKDKKIEITVNQEDVQNIIDCYEKDIELIEKLKEENTKLWEQKLEYIERIGNAIEYINNCLIGYKEQYEEHTFNYYNVSYDLESILEILKGEEE